jgi:hypothetical protein
MLQLNLYEHKLTSGTKYVAHNFICSSDLAVVLRGEPPFKCPPRKRLAKFTDFFPRCPLLATEVPLRSAGDSPNAISAHVARNFDCSSGIPSG